VLPLRDLKIVAFSYVSHSHRKSRAQTSFAASNKILRNPSRVRTPMSALQRARFLRNSLRDSRSTPPTFPEGRPQRQMPPDTKAPPPQDLSASEVEQQIQDKLNREPTLANTEIGVKIDAKSVTLTGSVDTENQRDLALRIAQSYAGHRRIVDKIKIQRQG
jgi:hypothetical protein